MEKKGLGVGALVLAIISIIVPVFGPYLTIISAALAAFTKRHEFGLAIGAIITNFVNILFLSPSTWLFFSAPEMVIIPLVWLCSQAVALFMIFKKNKDNKTEDFMESESSSSADSSKKIIENSDGTFTVMGKTFKEKKDAQDLLDFTG